MIAKEFLALQGSRTQRQRHLLRQYLQLHRGLPRHTLRQPMP